MTLIGDNEVPFGSPEYPVISLNSPTEKRIIITEN